VAPRVAVVIPNWNGMRWLAPCLASIESQRLKPDELIVVDNGSTDGSLEALRERAGVRVISLGENTGFAFAANRGVEACSSELVALVNTDVELEPDWLDRMVGALTAHPEAASAACKMVDLADPGIVYDAGDVLRRDGACEQRGRFESSVGRFDQPEEVFGACAGAALYRREQVLAVGGFDERFWTYLEDVDLALRLRLAGWSCRYEPAVARHAGEGSSVELSSPLAFWVERNTVLLMAKAFPLRWLPLVAYRQLGWLRHAFRAGRLRAHTRGALAALPRLPGMIRDRRMLMREAGVPIELVVPPRAIRGPAAGGHPSRHVPSH
jgi:GT2 family glycosyltransferase